MKTDSKYEKKYFKIILNTLILLSPLYIYGQYNVIRTIYENGYVTMYSEGISSSTVNNIFIQIIGGVYQILIFALLSTIPKEKNRKKIVACFYFLLVFIISLRGSRAGLFTGIFTLIWYFSYLYEEKIKFKKLALLFLALIIIGQIFFELRAEASNQRTSIVKKIENFIYQQGVTGTFLITPINYPEIFEKEKVPYIFSSIIGDKISSQKNEFLKVEKSNNIELGQKMSYFLNKESYIQGNGVGGNYILEMYDFGGKIGVFLLSSLGIIIIYYYTAWLKKTQILWLRIFLFSQISSIFIIPRATYIFLSFSKNQIVGCIFVSLLLDFLYCISSIKNKQTKEDRKKRETLFIKND